MNVLTFGFENMFVQMLQSSVFGLLALAGGLYLWLHRRPPLSTRKVRVLRDDPRLRNYRRSSR
ncbi:MAG TPA: hypothetical protein VGB77_20515 [Abditibacteriaceae bacterium]|jgi:hypothetical protein